MVIYIDSDFKCHVESAEGMRAYDVSAFDGKCDAYIEGYRYVPEGESWTRSDGVVFTGEMITPWKDYGLLDAAQRLYEQALILDMQQALKTLGVNADG